MGFEIEDSGLGPQEEFREDVFSIYGAVSQMEEFNLNGRGFALNICKKIVSQLGGEMKFK